MAVWPDELGITLLELGNGRATTLKKMLVVFSLPVTSYGMSTLTGPSSMSDDVPL